MEHKIDLLRNSLLKEFLEYGNNNKALSVYYHCLRKKKYNLADKIRIKYNLKVKRDAVQAFAMALIAMQKQNNKLE